MSNLFIQSDRKMSKQLNKALNIIIPIRGLTVFHTKNATCKKHQFLRTTFPLASIASIVLWIFSALFFSKWPYNIQIQCARSFVSKWNLFALKYRIPFSDNSPLLPNIFHSFAGHYPPISLSIFELQVSKYLPTSCYWGYVFQNNLFTVNYRAPSSARFDYFAWLVNIISVQIKLVVAPQYHLKMKHNVSAG